MIKSCLTPTTESDALDAMGLMLAPHDLAPFGPGVRWLTTAFDEEGNILGQIETCLADSGCGALSLHRVPRARTMSAKTCPALPS